MLFARTVGETGPPLVMLHGLLGQGRNLATAAAALAARGRVVTTLDLPDHGRSPWTDRIDYPSMADAVAAQLIADFGPVDLLGHSMGGKVAMLLALTRPALVRSLVAVDIAPVAYPVVGESEHARHLRMMRGLDLARLSSRAEADDVLATEIDDVRVRGFLLQNLAREGEHWRWRANLDVLARDLPALADFPETGARYSGPALFLAGGSSDYVSDERRPAITAAFPHARVVRLKGVGHWVHSEAPELFVETVERFLEQT